MNQNKKIIRKTGAAFLCAAMVANAGAAPVLAAADNQKDENIYVNLNTDGSVSGVYVVNEYELKEKTQITDYGNYTSVKNLTSDDAITLSGDKVEVEAPAGKFYYQGDIDGTEIPWDISITYKLDGQKLSAEELAGKSGKLKIVLSVKDNKDSDDKFFDNYLVQGTVTLDTKKCSSIQADGATQANVGSDRQLLYNIMAGQEKEFTITADVTDFEMDAISFQAVPMSFDIDSSSLDTSEIYDKTDEIKDAAKEFDDGATDLQDGASKLKDGSSELKDGASDLKDGTDELKDGTSNLKSGAGELSDGTDELASGGESLADGASSMKSGISSADQGAASVRAGAGSLVSVASQLSEGTRSLNSGMQELSKNLKKMDKGASRLNNSLTALSSQSGTLTDGSAQVLAALQQIQASLSTINVGSEAMQNQITHMGQSEEMQSLLNASTQIKAATESLADGSQSVFDGASALAQSCAGFEDLKSQNTDSAAYLRGIASQAMAVYGSLSATQKAVVDAAGDVSSVSANLENIASLLEANNSAYEGVESGASSVESGAAQVAQGHQS